ncbi:MAG: Ig-like domain-containing protein, partial [bacterium]|nr:Ig-like domain-containing protein [bacterium]
MPKLTTYATIVILACCPFAFFACGGDDPVSPPEDTTRPTVISVSPPNGSTFVSVTSDISVTFSEGMDRTTMILSTLTIEPAVIGTVS